MTQTKFHPSIPNFCCKNQSQKIIEELGDEVLQLIEEASKDITHTKRTAEINTLSTIYKLLIKKYEEVSDRHNR